MYTCPRGGWSILLGSGCNGETAARSKIIISAKMYVYNHAIKLTIKPDVYMQKR